MEGAAARDAGWPNAGQSDLHEGEVGTIASPQAERLECVIRTRASVLIADVTATKTERAPDQRPQHAFDWLLVAVLSMTAGSVDLIGFLAFGGLFTAHITGNIVILAAHYITGGFSRIGPLIAVPVFIAVLGTVVWSFEDKPKHQTLRALLILHAALLTGFFAVSTALGPFANPGGAVAASVGMLGVAAMATQNALVKLDLPGFPTTAVLTANTVQLTIELTTLVRGNTLPELALARRRIRMTLPAFAGFIAGCTTGGLLEVHFGLRALAFPVVMAVLAIPLSEYTARTVLTTKANFACAVSTADAKATIDNLSSGLGAHGFTRIVYGIKILKRRFGMSDNKQASTVEAQRGIVRPHQPGQDVFRSILPEEIDWKPFPSFPPSVRLAVVVGQPSEVGPYTIRVKAPHGAKLMPHRHPEDRVYTVISGVFYIGLGDQFDADKLQAYPAGSVIVLPGNTSHFHWAKSSEYITQVSAIGPLGLEYVNAKDDPRNQQPGN